MQAKQNKAIEINHLDWCNYHKQCPWMTDDFIVKANDVLLVRKKLKLLYVWCMYQHSSIMCGVMVAVGHWRTFCYWLKWSYPYAPMYLQVVYFYGIVYWKTNGHLYGFRHIKHQCINCCGQLIKVSPTGYLFIYHCNDYYYCVQVLLATSQKMWLWGAHWKELSRPSNGVCVSVWRAHCS